MVKLDKKTSITGLTMLVLGFGLGLLVKFYYPASSNYVAVRENNNDFKFINPILFVDNTKTADNKYNDLKGKINAYIKSITQGNEASEVSVYFRDLNSGHWLGINENDEYTPASMLKVAILISYLRQAETDPGVLDRMVRLSPNSFNLNSLQTYKPKDPIVPGGTYSIGDLLLKMSINSDNNAMALLTDAIATSSITELYKDLELPVDNKGEVTSISPAMYSHFFRVLYNSSYVSHPLSEKILSILSQTDFANGLQAGVPATTTVSHKFGERTLTDSQGIPTERQLHDCGIVYYPEHPYFLCVMTKGNDFKPLEGVISSISKITWDYVNASSTSN